MAGPMGLVAPALTYPRPSPCAPSSAEATAFQAPGPVSWPLASLPPQMPVHGQEAGPAGPRLTWERGLEGRRSEAWQG